MLWPLLTITTFTTHIHGDSMTDPDQRAESVKINSNSCTFNFAHFLWIFKITRSLFFSPFLSFLSFVPLFPSFHIPFFPPPNLPFPLLPFSIIHFFLSSLLPLFLSFYLPFFPYSFLPFFLWSLLLFFFFSSLGHFQKNYLFPLFPISIFKSTLTY